MQTLNNSTNTETTQLPAGIQVSYTPHPLSRSLATTDLCVKYLHRVWPLDSVTYDDKVVILFLNHHFKVITHYVMGQTSKVATNLNIKLLISLCAQTNAKWILIAQNNWDRDLEPTKEEVKYTEKLEEKLKLIDVAIYDRIIINEYNHRAYSQIVMNKYQ